jgi:hypothetical protein
MAAATPIGTQVPPPLRAAARDVDRRAPKEGAPLVRFAEARGLAISVRDFRGEEEAAAPAGERVRADEPPARPPLVEDAR